MRDVYRAVEDVEEELKTLKKKLNVEGIQELLTTPFNVVTIVSMDLVWPALAFEEVDYMRLLRAVVSSSVSFQALNEILRRLRILELCVRNTELRSLFIKGVDAYKVYKQLSLTDKNTLDEMVDTTDFTDYTMTREDIQKKIEGYKRKMVT
jgi:hypothetical protein